MGTSGAYGGSGGRAWGKARKQANVFADDPSDANGRTLLANIANALDWNGSPKSARPQRGSGGGGGGGAAGGGTGGGSAGGGSGGRSRSRAQAASIGAGVGAAGLALRNRDAAVLLEYGLNLQHLETLDVHEQAREILDAVGAAVGGVQDEEIAFASAQGLLALLDDPAATAADVVRVFAAEYVFQVALTEIGDGMRSGTRSGAPTADAEAKLHGLIEVCVNQIALPAQIDGRTLEGVISSALEDARTFLADQS